jgi:hypothetical protein
MPMLMMLCSSFSGSNTRGVTFLTCGGCEIARVSSHMFIAQQVVGNNVHELVKGGSSSEV